MNSLPDAPDTAGARTAGVRSDAASRATATGGGLGARGAGARTKGACGGARGVWVTAGGRFGMFVRGTIGMVCTLCATVALLRKPGGSNSIV